MDEKRNHQTTGQSNRSSESARDLVAQSMYHLVRLTRLGFQAAVSGMEKLEESMARRHRERAAERKPMGEAPPAERAPGTSTPEAKPSARGEAGERHQPGSHDPEQSRH